MNLTKPLTCLVLTLALEEVSANETKDDLCVSNESLIASCRLAEAKNRILSFCASPDTKAIFYRFGTASTIEFMRSFSGDNPVFRWADAATHTTYFGFRSSGYAYVFGVPQEVLGAKAFLEVTNLNGVVKRRACTENSFGRKSIISEAIAAVEDGEVRGSDFLFTPDSNFINSTLN